LSKEIINLARIFFDNISAAQTENIFLNAATPVKDNPLRI
jgi:hypothetical protein